MKYIELKASLKNKVENAYLIFGDDRYLCYDALKKIEAKLHDSEMLQSITKQSQTLDTITKNIEFLDIHERFGKLL